MFLIALLLQAASPPLPTAPPLHGGPSEMICPVGGERFSAWRPSMYSTFGERPDGKPYSYLPFPFPLPECPGNKLIVFDDYSAAETTRLATLIATAEYKRLGTTDTTYYRAYWLADKLGRPKTESLGLLLSAIWQVTPEPAAEAATERPEDRDSLQQQRRYQALFIEQVRQLGLAAAPDQAWLQARAANAARQMKRFDEAEALCKQAEQTLASRADKGGWDTYLANLRTVIARKDASVEPLDMIPDQQAGLICADTPPSDPVGKAVCARPKVAEMIERVRQSKR
ncbi:hypothetical protein ACSBM8_00955 [Sphingomonas sp. ASY06-1R]|uniref:hypothetical protein n=1 Tax=Sphingomonas sp. ASY06-1R TaxID=3445771 RepID=UPI003FA2B3D2